MEGAQTRVLCHKDPGSLWLESQAERGFADTKFSALAEHGGANALLFEKCAVGGVEVAEIDIIFADLDDAVMARDFGILQGDVGAVAADNDARFLERVGGARAGTGDDGEDYVFRAGENGGGVLHDQGGLRSGAVSAGERGERRNSDSGVGMAVRVHDSRRVATRAAEFYFGMRAEVGILEHVLRAAVTACCLHGLKVAPRRRQ